MRCNLARQAILGLGLAAACMVVVSARPPQESDSQTRHHPDPLENSIDRWNRMSPEERERELAKLPPARARLIRQRLKRYNQMNPEEQQALRQRYQTFSQLPPEKRRIVRERLQEFGQLPAARRPIVHHEVEQLRLAPEGERESRLNSDEFRRRYSAQEQQIIRDLTEYLEPGK